MFGQSEVMAVDANPVEYPYAAKAAYASAKQQTQLGGQPEYGVMSAMQELAATVDCAVSNASELKSALGISTPAQSREKQSDSSLVGLLRTLTMRLRDAAADTNDALRHIRS